MEERINMTAKRYFKRMWEDEFYIFDSETISEKEFDEKVEYEDYQAFVDSMLGDEVVELLNEQHETIERLKDNCKVLDEVKCEIAEENEQLKQRINVLDDQITAQGIVIEGYQNRNQKLFDENEQLKSLNKYLTELLKDLNGVSIEIERVIE